MSRNTNWTREETIIAFNVYCKIPFKKSSDVLKIEHHRNHFKQHSDETVGLPTRASSKVSPAFSGFPNDWLSPTDRLLNAHGIGQCGALHPIPLLSAAPGRTAVRTQSLCSCFCTVHDTPRRPKCQYFFIDFLQHLLALYRFGWK